MSQITVIVENNVLELNDYLDKGWKIKNTFPTKQGFIIFVLEVEKDLNTTKVVTLPEKYKGTCLLIPKVLNSNSNLEGSLVFLPETQEYYIVDNSSNKVNKN